MEMNGFPRHFRSSTKLCQTLETNLPITWVRVMRVTAFTAHKNVYSWKPCLAHTKIFCHWMAGERGRQPPPPHPVRRFRPINFIYRDHPCTTASTKNVTEEKDVKFFMSLNYSGSCWSNRPTLFNDQLSEGWGVSNVGALL